MADAGAAQDLLQSWAGHRQLSLACCCVEKVEKKVFSITSEARLPGAAAERLQGRSLLSDEPFGSCCLWSSEFSSELGCCSSQLDILVHFCMASRCKCFVLPAPHRAQKLVSRPREQTVMVSRPTGHSLFCDGLLSVWDNFLRG